MGDFFQQIFTFLTTPPGNLPYHVVLAFSVAGALQAAVNHWRSSDLPQYKRMVLGLSLLLIARLALFIGAGVAWQGLINEHVLLPPLDRAVTLLSLIWIIWLWAFPEPVRLADAATLLLNLLALTLSALAIVWWFGQGNDLFYNGSLLDVIGEILNLAILAGGVFTLWVRKPDGWGFGFSMLALLFLGHLTYLLIPIPQGDFSGLIRLFQMSAYPLLLALPQRSPLLLPDTRTTRPPTIHERRRFGADPELLQSFLALEVETEPAKICRAITRTISHTMLADLCLLLSPPDIQGQLAIQCAYDLIRQENLPGAHLDGLGVPLIVDALQRGRPLRLPASSTSPDLTSLAQSLGIQRAGPLLASSILSPNGELLFGIALLSPYSSRGWSSEDEARLESFNQPLAHLLQRNQVLAAFQEELAQNRQTLEAAQAEARLARRENENLLAQLESAQDEKKNSHSQAASLAALISAQEEAQELIVRLQAENERLRQEAAFPSDSSQVKRQNRETSSPETEQLEGELRLALQEIARLKSDLLDADQKLLSANTQMTNASSTNGQNEMIASLAQELRQPISSILGYTDFLLGESVGILGALQRKFLERVRISTERMNRLIEDLIQITALETGQIHIASEPVDLNIVIDEAIAQTSEQLREKNIALRVDLPERLPLLNADRDALQQVLINLLENAGAVTPLEGEITLRASSQGNDEDSVYALLQVADKGGGIPSEDIPRVFSRLYPNEAASIPGVGDTGVSLSIVKTLVEALGGRIWVDSDPGLGSTFSILMPVSSPQDGSMRARNE